MNFDARLIAGHSFRSVLLGIASDGFACSVSWGVGLDPRFEACLDCVGGVGRHIFGLLLVEC